MTSTRAQILDAALDLFSEKGYGQTSLREVAERLEFTKAALYYHHKAKEDILTALATPFLEAVEQRIAAAHVRRGDMARPLLEAWFDGLATNPRLASLLLRDPSVTDQEAGQRLRHVAEGLRGRLAGRSAASRIRAAAALQVIEVSVIDFEGESASQVRDVAIEIALAALTPTTTKR